MVAPSGLLHFHPELCIELKLRDLQARNAILQRVGNGFPTYYKQKEQTRKTKILYVCSFLLVIFLLTQKGCYASHNDVARKCSQ